MCLSVGDPSNMLAQTAGAVSGDPQGRKGRDQSAPIHESSLLLLSHNDSVRLRPVSGAWRGKGIKIGVKGIQGLGEWWCTTTRPVRLLHNPIWFSPRGERGP
jgi:hypothetical protein